MQIVPEKQIEEGSLALVVTAQSACAQSWVQQTAENQSQEDWKETYIDAFTWQKQRAIAYTYGLLSVKGIEYM